MVCDVCSMMNLLETSAAYYRTDPAPALTLTWEEIWNRLTLVAMNLCVRKVQCRSRITKGVSSLSNRACGHFFVAPLVSGVPKLLRKVTVSS